MAEEIKTITQLTGKVVTGAVFKHPPVQVIHDNTHSGFFRSVEISGEGIVFRRGQVRVQLPLADLLLLVETLEPNFAPYLNATPPLKIQE